MGKGVLRTRKTSIAKVEANRRNAQHSTGPNTPDGKNIVRGNAIRHGLLAQEVVVISENGSESEEEFKELLSSLYECCMPVGLIEEILVEKIAVAYWRLARVIRCENGEIRKRLDNAVWEIIFERFDEFSFEKKFLMLEESRRKLERTTIGLEYLIRILSDIRSSVNEAGRLTDETKEKLLETFAREEGGFAFTVLLFDHIASHPEGLADNAVEIQEKIDPKRCRNAILQVIDKELRRLKHFQKGFEQKENLETEASVMSMALPDKEALDRIQRYESSIERQFYRALHELERLQSARRGEKPPAPIAVDIDVTPSS